MNKNRLDKKLSLNKFTVASLDESKSAVIKGGFTYSLSLGQRCRESMAAGATSPYECGQIEATRPETGRSYMGPGGECEPTKEEELSTGSEPFDLGI
ncbi:class I lanthipeptide [Chitinophaga flava]|uniref:Uncharacterized protein n=1 Tax=Chitinophaga flava TaxID=2259036 RepID=A0A365XXS0_9BACT|nr:class I lanthipeptide [Chitinophaga flava]RBL91142.1 hypothetical protein DF182_00530 [Chitinophaga flava]